MPTNSPKDTIPSARGPLGDALRYVSNRLGFGGIPRTLGEEDLSMFLLGGITLTVPWMVKLHAANSQTSAMQCAWSTFKKSATAANPQSEAATGADFAIVLLLPNNAIKLALFQAKKATGTRERDWKINVNRVPSDPTSPRPSQMVTLFLNAMSVVARSDGHPPPWEGTHVPAATSGEELSQWAQPLAWLRQEITQLPGPDVGNMGVTHWVHYLAYGPGEPRCRTLGSISKERLSEELLPGRKTRNEDVPAHGKTLWSVLQNGFENGSQNGSDWLDIEKKHLKRVVGELTPFMPVHALVPDTTELKMSWGLAGLRSFALSATSGPLPGDELLSNITLTVAPEAKSKLEGEDGQSLAQQDSIEADSTTEQTGTVRGRGLGRPK